MGIRAIAGHIPVLAQSEAPAGGAPLEDLVIASVAALIGLVTLVLVAWRYRSGGTSQAKRLVGFAERVSGLPPWAALPAAITTISLLTAVFGFYWDVSTHIDNGRDPGPFANPSHYLILFGLIGIAVAGFVSVVIGSPQTKTSIRIREGWHAPLGGVAILVCGVIALLGFPLDDVWHRLFGQDVTLWGPTHIQMVGGASLTTLALWILIRETRLDPSPTQGWGPRLVWLREASIAGALLLGLSTLQGEFDFSVPQFRLLYHPVLIMLAASIGLVVARMKLGRGGALAAVGFFLLIRIGLTLIIGPVLGRSILHFPLYLIEALVVEFVATRVPIDDHPRFGLWSGLGIGTVGLAAEWLWSQVWMPLPWPAALLPEAAILGLAAAVSGAVLGTFIGRALSAQARGSRQMPRWLLPAAGATIVACLVIPLPKSAPPDITATITLDEAGTPDEREVFVTAKLDPPDVADDPMWFYGLAWQGLEWERGMSPQVELEEIEPGTYRTTEPLPVYGDWKALLRLHSDSWLTVLPVYLPEDRAIPAPEVPAVAGERAFVSDHEVVQREAVGGSPALQNIAYVLLLGIAIVWLASLGWALARLQRADVHTQTHRASRIGEKGPALSNALRR